MIPIFTCSWKWDALGRSLVLLAAKLNQKGISYSQKKKPLYSSMLSYLARWLNWIQKKHVVSGLRHFSEYIISLASCKSWGQSQTSTSKINKLGKESIIVNKNFFSKIEMSQSLPRNQGIFSLKPQKEIRRFFSSR